MTEATTQPLAELLGILGSCPGQKVDHAVVALVKAYSKIGASIFFIGTAAVKGCVNVPHEEPPTHTTSHHRPTRVAVMFWNPTNFSPAK